jgi:CBS domain-containing protein
MATVEDVLLDKGSDVVAILPTATIRQAVRKMVEAKVGCLVVEVDDRAVAIFTERDLLRRVVDAGLDVETTPISAVMSAPLFTCTPADDLGHCARLLDRHKFRHLVVLDGTETVGVISMRDLVPALNQTTCACAAGHAN